MTSTMRFLPWMRRGMVRSLAAEADAEGMPTAAIAEIEAGVTVGSTEVTRKIRLRGPGSVIGLAPHQVVRRDPAPDTRDFEANYFPAIELLSPDLPWMFTPASPHATSGRLIPWLVLVIVEERAGVSLGSRTGAPLEVLSIDDARRELPDLGDAWAWAHVQASIAPDASIEAAFDETPEAFVARLLCPRRLAAGTRYLACVVPSFDHGVSAGLGRDVDLDAPLKLAWSSDTSELELPVYTSWRFSTAAEPGDFEELVKRLRARTLVGVGVHDLDIGTPGSPRLPQAPGTLVEFRGALVAPALPEPTWDPEHKAELQGALGRLLDASPSADAGADPSPYEARRHDPVVAPPVYGSLPARVDRVDAAPAWLGEANLDPVHRAAAGLGAEVVRRNQEPLVAEVWDQVAALREVNRTLNRARLALEVGARLKTKIDALDDGTLVQLSRPVHSRIKRTEMPKTLQGRLAESALPSGLVSGAFRRRARTLTVSKALNRSGDTAPLAPKLTRAFLRDPAGMLEFARFTVPHGTVFLDMTSAETSKPVVPQLRAMDLELDLGMGAGGAVAEYGTIRLVADRGALSIEGRTSAKKKQAPNVAVIAAATAHPMVLVSPTPVAIDAGPPRSLGLDEAAAVAREKLDPSAVLRVRVRSSITAPASAWTSEPVPAAMTYSPQLRQPAYELLARMDPELLCPGISDVPANTVGLAAVNPAFVEAFLLGANHELSRELVWREVPVDPADTWMRTFWDPVEDAAPDITRIASWKRTALGTHRPTAAVDPAQVLVLVVKGELLRRYPGTLVYAARAEWTAATADQPAERIEGSEVKHPIFVGALGSDVMFLGFRFDAADVDLEVAGSTVAGGSHPGWFFVFEQPPTEPRFGLDVGAPDDAGSRPRVWKDVSWFHALNDASSTATHVPLEHLASVTRKYDDATDSANAWSETWARDAAAMARVTLQRPVRMLVHADQMLRVAPESGK